MTSVFWKDDVSVLFQHNKILEIFPSRYYDINRKLNSIVRLSILYTIIMYLIKRDNKLLLIPIIILIITYGINNKKGEKVEFTNPLEDIISEYDMNSSCKIPTKDNPFMNTNITEYGKPSVNRSCPSYNNVGVQNRIHELYGDGLYKDFQDVFDKNTGERQFITMPNTQVPNDTDSYMKWLYGGPSTCKEGNSINCVNQYGRSSGGAGTGAAS